MSSAPVVILGAMANRRTLGETSIGQHLRVGHHGYGALLALILVSLTFQLAAPEGDVAHVVTIVLQGGVLLASLWTSLAPSGALRAGGAVLAVVTIATAVGFSAAGDVDEAGARVVSLVLIVFAPVVIARGVFLHFHEEGRVTVQTMFGVLCIYLLIGAAFAFSYGVVDELGGSSFFKGIALGTTSDYLYFSFATLTTVGYGDLVAATDLGRSLAITEALLGQIYMVTVVALIVSNLRRAPA